MNDAAEQQQTAFDVDVAPMSASTHQPSWWQVIVQRLTAIVNPQAVNYDDALIELDDAIALNPDAAVNYVLRGEIYMKLKNNTLAAADFEHALSLTAESVENSDWGFLEQVMQDRARQGLRRVLPRLTQANSPLMADKG